MSKKIVITPKQSPAAVGPYNHAIRIGDLLFCAGQIPIEPASGNLVAGDIKAQTTRVLENVKAILEDQKLTFANVVKSTVFMTNLGEFAAMNEVYAEFFGDTWPTRTTVEAGFVAPGMKVEIDCIAYAPLEKEGKK